MLVLGEMEFRYVPYAEFAETLLHEKEIFNQLDSVEIFDVDDFGDMKFDGDTPIVLGERAFEAIAVSESNPFRDVNGKNRFIPTSVLNGFQDVYDVDHSMINKDTRLLVAYLDGKYQGSVWTFENEKFFGIYGIRSSLSNYLHGVKGTARALMHHIMEQAAGRTIVVPWPLESMIPLLESLSFVEQNSNDLTPERLFLTPYTLTSNYWTYRAE